MGPGAQFSASGYLCHRKAGDGIAERSLGAGGFGPCGLPGLGGPRGRRSGGAGRQLQPGRGRQVRPRSLRPERWGPDRDQRRGPLCGARDHRGGASRVLRFQRDGSLDDSFGAGGSVAAPAGTWHALARQTDGGILLAGTSGHDFAVARLAADGQPDPTFGNGGTATLHVDVTRRSQTTRPSRGPSNGWSSTAAAGSSRSATCAPVTRTRNWNPTAPMRPRSSPASPRPATSTRASAPAGAASSTRQPPSRRFSFSDLGALAIQADGRILVGGSTSRATRAGTSTSAVPATTCWRAGTARICSTAALAPTGLSAAAATTGSSADPARTRKAARRRRPQVVYRARGRDRFRVQLVVRKHQITGVHIAVRLNSSNGDKAYLGWNTNRAGIRIHPDRRFRYTDSLGTAWPRDAGPDRRRLPGVRTHRQRGLQDRDPQAPEDPLRCPPRRIAGSPRRVDDGGR